MYDSVNSVDINENKTDYISHKFLQSQTPFGLFFSRLNLKVEFSIILFCN